MSLSWFRFGDLDTRDYGIVVSADDIYSLPVRDYTEHEVIGRNGNIYTDNGRFKNIERTYHCELPTQTWLGFGDRFEEFRRRLAMATGYQTLQDSYSTDVTREAILTATVTPKSNGPAWIIGAFDVTFSCKPQIYTVAGQTRMNIGTVVMGAIAGCETAITGSSDSTLTTSAAYCRCGGISVSGGSSIVLSTTHTAHSSMSIYVAQYNSVGGVAPGNMIKAEWVSVAKGASVTYKLESGTRVIRLCWNAGTLTTTDETAQQMVTCITTANTYRFGTNRIYHYFSGNFATQPILEFNSTGTHDAAAVDFNGVAVRIGARSGADKVYCDCEQEIFTDNLGNSVNSVCGVFKDMTFTKASPVFPELKPGMNILKVTWPTRDKYDPLYSFVLTTREWRV